MGKLNKKQRRSSIGRFLLDVIKPIPALSNLGKRRRNDVDDTHAPDRDMDMDTDTQPESSYSQTPTSPIPRPVTHPSSARACIALQNEDPVEDAVVITALTVVPFCCHADLITMTRSQLLAVATTLNAKLPYVMQIDTDPSRSDAFIRHSIEFLVGLRTIPPVSQQTQTGMHMGMGMGTGRPRPHSFLGTACPTTSIDTTTARTPRRSLGDRAPPPSPTSPLANRSRVSMSFGTPSLAMLPEDSQEDEHDETPPQKRRHMSAPLLDYNYPGPLTRAQSRRVAPLLAAKDSPEVESPRARASARASTSKPDNSNLGANVLRRRSLPLPYVVRSARGGSASAIRSEKRTKTSFAMTSTPKKRAAAGLNSPMRPRPRSLLVDVLNLAGAGAFAREREREGEESCVTVGSVGDGMEEVTFGLDGFTMPLGSVSVDEGQSDVEMTHD